LLFLFEWAFADWQLCNAPVYRTSLIIAHLNPPCNFLERAMTTATDLIAQYRRAMTNAGGISGNFG
jgi:hypothetical protein